MGDEHTTESDGASDTAESDRWSRLLRSSTLVVVALAVAGVLVGARFTDALAVGGSDSAAAGDLLAELSPDRLGITARVVFWTDGLDITTAEPRREVLDALAAIEARPDVAAVDDPFALGTVSTAGDAVFADVRLNSGTEPSAAVLRDLERPLRDLAAVRATVGGPLVDAADDPSAGSESIGLAVALVVLTVVLGSLAAAALPLVASLLALSGGFGLLALLSRVIDVPSLAPQLAVVIGLGVGIDDALLMVARYREELSAGRDHADALSVARRWAGRSILVAGATTVVSIVGLAICGVGALTAMGVATAVVVAVTVVVNVTVVPAALGLWGRRLRPPRPAPARPLPPWTRWALTHRVAALVIGVGALVILASPAADLTLAYDDAATATTGRAPREAYDRLARTFGAGHNADLFAVVDLRGVAPEDRGDTAEEVARSLASDPGVARVLPAEFGPGAEAAVVRLLAVDPPSSPATSETIDRLRAGDLDVDDDVHLGGTTASRLDFTRRVAERLWWFVGAVVAMSLLVLTAAFRAPIVALKAAVLNLLSVAAAYGVVVAVFSRGWGASLIGVEATQGIDPFVPVFLFAILFGLSIDYEVFLIDRIREHRAVHGDNDDAIRDAVSATGRVIGSAALIMIAVFAGFLLSDEVVTKMFGVGLVAAVAFDVTVVRLFVLPAAMSLLGDLNWWTPWGPTGSTGR